MVRVYDFQTQFNSQKELYKSFKQWLSARERIIKVWDASTEDDRQGIDLFIKVACVNGENIHSVQIKVDHLADKTGYLPIEVISQAYVHKNSIIGAEFNMERVDYLFFILAKSRRVIGFKFQSLLQYVIDNYKRFKNFRAKNKSWVTLGCLIPIHDIEHLAIWDEYLA